MWRNWHLRQKIVAHHAAASKVCGEGVDINNQRKSAEIMKHQQ